jgi:hypothetical protein
MLEGRAGEERTNEVNAEEEAGGLKGSERAIRLVQVTHSPVFCTGESPHRNARNALLLPTCRSAPLCRYYNKGFMALLQQATEQRQAGSATRHSSRGGSQR